MSIQLLTTPNNFNLYMGSMNSVESQNATSTSTGSLIVSGGCGIAKDLYVGGTIYGGTTPISYGTNDSSSTNTGALVIAGGVGIAKHLYGTQINLVASAFSPATITNYMFSSYGETNNSLMNTLQNLSSLSNSSSDWIALTDATNTPTLGMIDMGINSSQKSSGLAGSGVADGYLVTASTILGVGGNLYISSDVSKKIYIVTPTIHNSTINSTSTSTGSLVINGGASIVKDLYVGGTIYGNVNSSGITTTPSLNFDVAGAVVQPQTVNVKCLYINGMLIVNFPATIFTGANNTFGPLVTNNSIGYIPSTNRSCVYPAGLTNASPISGLALINGYGNLVLYADLNYTGFTQFSGTKTLSQNAFTLIFYML